MPLPGYSRIVKLKNDFIAIPILSEIQSAATLEICKDPSYDLTVTLADTTKKAIRKHVLGHIAFQHESADAVAERAEEVELMDRVKAEAQANPEAVTTSNTDEDLGEDADAVQKTLRGYTIAGWERAIQKKITNRNSYVKRTQGTGTTKAKKTAATAPTTSNTVAATAAPHAPSSPLDLATAMRILGLVDYDARKKFHVDQHEAILKLARTFEGSNTGANFHRAEKMLWDTADKKHWQKELDNELADISPEQRMAALCAAFSEALTAIQDSGRFPLFCATLQLAYLDGQKISFEVGSGEAVPAGAVISTGFQDNLKNEALSQEYLSKMHEWVAEPLQEDLAIAQNPAKSDVHPEFLLSESEIENLSPRELVASLSEFLGASFAHAFGDSPVIWDKITQDSSRFYDSDRLAIAFPLQDPTKLTASQRFALASALVVAAGPGTANLFRCPEPDSTEQALAEERERIRRETTAESERVQREALDLELTRKVQEAADATEQVRQDSAREADRSRREEADRLAQEQADREAEAAETERVRLAVAANAERVRLETEAAIVEAERIRLEAEAAAWKESEDTGATGGKENKSGAGGKKKGGRAGGKPRDQVMKTADAAEVGTRKSTRQKRAPQRLGQEDDDVPTAKRAKTS
ncbi:hypothetical protein GGX14DRAFT_393604 [Mycena pura]|uniref:Uncharacterized protein n=1 Tax=Mycena pura TaxID=153505 RepID=A0AAD6YEQ5_9AGAR|nr:hypothetical protein GGX14DRAFT_393604 [Mycena pura]